MIISASRRTDIPAFYSDWFYNRLQKGYVLVRNPMNYHQVSAVPLTRDVVDGIVFWTKNPARMLPKLHLLKNYNYYFQYTLNPYDTAFEPELSNDAVIATFKDLSLKLGRQRVIWRYDPIILTAVINEQWHYKQFEKLARELHSYTSKCVISFVDFYQKVNKKLKEFKVLEIGDEKKREIAARLNQIAQAFALQVETCAEDVALEDLGISHAKCIDISLLEALSGVKLDIQRDKNQRRACGCAASIDIGAYNTCIHGCVYCYATFNKKLVQRNITSYDLNSPLLCSQLTEKDVVKVRTVSSGAILQKSLFD